MAKIPVKVGYRVRYGRLLGKIIHEDRGSVLFEGDAAFGGHDGDGLGKEGCCWWIGPTDAEPVMIPQVKRTRL